MKAPITKNSLRPFLSISHEARNPALHNLFGLASMAAGWSKSEVVSNALSIPALQRGFESTSSALKLWFGEITDLPARTFVTMATPVSAIKIGADNPIRANSKSETMSEY